MSVQRPCSDRVATVHHPISKGCTRYTLITRNPFRFQPKRERVPTV